MNETKISGYYCRKSPTNDLNSYSCIKCGKVYSCKSWIYSHLKYECGKEPRFRCPYCEHKAKQRSNLRKHIRTQHLGKNECGKEVKFKCPYCPYESNQRCNLKKHIGCQHLVFDCS